MDSEESQSLSQAGWETGGSILGMIRIRQTFACRAAIRLLSFNHSPSLGEKCASQEKRAQNSAAVGKNWPRSMGIVSIGHATHGR